MDTNAFLQMFKPIDYGQAVGQGIANASNTVNFMNVAQQMQQRDQATGLSKKAAAGDSSALAQLAAVDPQSAVHIQAFRKNASDAQKEEVAARALKVGQVAQVSTDPQSWDANMSAAGFPELQGHFERRNMSLALAGLIPKALTEPYTLKPGETRYGADNKPIASVPAEPKAEPSDIQGYKLAKSQGFKGRFVQYKQDLAKAGASNINLGQTPENAGKVGMLEQAKSDIESAKTMLFPGGTLDKNLVMAISVPFTAGMPGNTRAREVYSRIQNAVAAKLRLETGAAANAGEVENIAKRFMPTIADTPASAMDKMNRLEGFMTGTLSNIKGYVPSSGMIDRPGQSEQDAAAMAWARANPNDPRAQKIMELNNAVQP